MWQPLFCLILLIGNFFIVTTGTAFPNCGSKADGFYEIDECGTEFYSCQNEQLRNLSCPSTLFFNGLTGFCEDLESFFLTEEILVPSLNITESLPSRSVVHPKSSATQPVLNSANKSGVESEPSFSVFLQKPAPLLTHQHGSYAEKSTQVLTKEDQSYAEMPNDVNISPSAFSVFLPTNSVSSKPHVEVLKSSPSFSVFLPKSTQISNDKQPRPSAMKVSKEAVPSVSAFPQKPTSTLVHGTYTEKDNKEAIPSFSAFIQTPTSTLVHGTYAEKDNTEEIPSFSAFPQKPTSTLVHGTYAEKVNKEAAPSFSAFIRKPTSILVHGTYAEKVNKEAAPSFSAFIRKPTSTLVHGTYAEKDNTEAIPSFSAFIRKPTLPHYTEKLDDEHRASFSVFLPNSSVPSSYRPPHVEELESMPSFSVFLPDSTSAFGGHQTGSYVEELGNETESLDTYLPDERPPKSRIVYDDDHHRPYVQELRSKEFVSSDHSSSSEPNDQSEVIGDQFLSDEQQISNAKPYSKQDSSFIDHFKGKNRYGPMRSVFAPSQFPSNTGHDAFKKGPTKQPIQSGFAPSYSRIEVGHDIFKSRKARSVVSHCLALKEALNFTKINGEQRAVAACTSSNFPHGCQSFYIACVNGYQVRRSCAAGMFLDSRKETCADRDQVEACNPPKLPSRGTPDKGLKTSHQSTVSSNQSVTHFEAKVFCTNRSDGFFRHPKNCSRILQCFDHELYEYPSCQHSLAFDEAASACNYPSRVPGCSAEANDKAMSGCVHGAHIPNDSDCSTFYRCVWDRLVLMSCPDGTVFNPNIQVCDYRQRVPHCNKFVT